MISASDILNAKILIVDDQATNVALLEQMLTEAGYVAISSTREPREVCELHRKHRYDLILLDLQMPGMDGFQVMEGLKEFETGGYLPVLVLTAQPGHKLRALKTGAKDFVSKPFDLGEVLMRVHNMLEVRLLHLSEASRNSVRLENSQRIAALGDWEYDFGDQRLVWSEGVYRILGISRPEFPPSPETFYARVHAEDREFVRQEKKASAEGLVRVDFEFRILRPDGEVRHVHQIAEMVFDDQGRPVREAGTLQDITERKRAGEALRQSEERHRLMFERNPSPMWVFDRETFVFLTVNDAAVALFGYSREEFLRMTVAEISPVDMAPGFFESTGLTAHPFRATGHYHYRKKDGTTFPVDIFTHGIDFAGRRARLVLGVDTTESEQTAAALRASEVRFRALSESAPIGIFECDAAGKVIYYNSALITLLDRPVAEIIGENWIASIHPDDREVVTVGWTRSTEVGNKWDRDLRLLRPDGSVRWVHSVSVPNYDALGQITGFIGTVEDITERRAAEVVIHESEERYRKLLMLSPDANFVYTDGLITLVNWAFCQLMGATDPQQLIGLTALSIAHPDFHELIRGWQSRRLERLDDQPEALSEMKFIRLDGSLVDVEVAAVAFDFHDRKDVQVIARDITARKRLDEHFLQAQKMEALGQFSGGVAHDFNNILAVITGYTELARMNLTECPVAHDYLGAVLKASGRAIDLVRQILTFSRQEPQERRALQLQTVVDESIKLLRATLPSSIEFDTAVAADAPTVLADANQLHQILMNLGVNAWHAMKDNPGRLQVRLERCLVDAAQAAHQPRLQPGLYARVSVSDTGCGMTPATLRRIFEPFFTTKPPGEGTGLGLSVVQGIMENHDGAVTVYSHPGEGTVFHLYFPAHAGEAAEVMTVEGVVPRGHGQRVLVVDDEELLAQLSRETLVTLGYEVESTSQPAVALALVQADPGRFALVLTDQTMPGLTGLVLATQLHQIRADLPVILMTGYNASLTPDRIAAAGIRQLLLKPISLHLLATSVQSALSSQPTR